MAVLLWADGPPAGGSKSIKDSPLRINYKQQQAKI
jgi:hypothetical protein